MHQVDIANAAFAPTEGEIDLARRQIEAHEEVEELLRLADPQNTGTISKEKFMGLPCWKVPGM